MVGRASAAAPRPGTWLAVTLLLLAIAPPEDPSSTGATPSDLAIVVATLLAVRVVLRDGQLAIIRSVPAVGFLAIGTMSVVAAVLGTNYPQSLVGGIRFVELFLLTPVTVMV